MASSFGAVRKTSKIPPSPLHRDALEANDVVLGPFSLVGAHGAYRPARKLRNRALT